MEKKGNRNSSSSSRGASGTDLKKSQDVATGKSWPRGSGGGAPGRRREPPCGFSKAPEPSRKPQPQKNAKAVDKRPRTKGAYYSVARSEAPCLDDTEGPELGSVFSPGSKKQSLNHLLNFSYAPREGYQPERRLAKHGGKMLETRKHKYNKEHFLQANCQFIVNEKGDYRQYMNNPDALVDWDLIEQVNVLVFETPSCPICLYPPVAAKMTKCGHVYCWSCILHYLALSDKQWRKCPICYDSVYKNDLKSVIAIPHPTFNLNDTITFKLMKRLRGSLIAYPIDAQVPQHDNIFNVSDGNMEMCYSKLLLANKKNILDIIDRESTELEVQSVVDEECPEKCFIEEAVQLLSTRRKGVLESDCGANGFDKTSEIKNLVLVPENKVHDGDGNNYGDGEFFPTSQENSVQTSKFHYFYQAADGQHIYLHAINARMLERTYGSLEFGPKTVTGKILEKEGGSMTEDLRKRLRCLQHLPVTCQFEVAEIKLTEPVINRDTMEHFQEQIEIRKKRRQRRAKEEKRREKRIEAEENRKIGKYSTPILHLDNKLQFPDFREADKIEQRLRTESESTLANSSDSDLASFSNMSLESTYTGPSFASMLATEKKTSWPTLKSQPKQSTPVKPINANGWRTIPTSSSRVTNRNEDSYPEPEDYEPVPYFSRSFGDALAHALARSVDDDDDSFMISGKTKKKKNKQKVLFSTHMVNPEK